VIFFLRSLWVNYGLLKVADRVKRFRFLLVNRLCFNRSATKNQNIGITMTNGQPMSFPKQPSLKSGKGRSAC